MQFLSNIFKLQLYNLAYTYVGIEYINLFNFILFEQPSSETLLPYLK